MLDYEWGNPSSMMLSTGDEPTSQDSDPTRTIFDHYSQTFNDSFLQTPNSYAQHHHHHFLQAQATAHFNHPLYDPRAYNAACASTYQANVVPNPSSMLTLEPNPGPIGYMVKTEPAAGGGVDFASRIGLNLGGRTYFSSSEDDFVNRLYRRSRPLEAGFVNAPRCQAEGCNADLTHAKHYHRRHKVCDFHSKASTVIAAGLTQRFCQQCSRFHLLTEFDNGKRSCRKRLADHNRRRRKSSQQQNQDQSKSHPSASQSAPSETLTIGSPPESGAQSSSSVTIAISPPRISLDCFGQRLYQATTTTTTTTSTSSASTSSLFYSNG